MEGNKKQANHSASSSFTAELFGDNESLQDQQSKGIFDSIFPHPSKVVARNSASSELLGPNWQKHASGNQAWPTNMYGNSAIGGEGARGNMVNKEQRVEPCHLSSSIYYGGQDVYSRSPSSQVPAPYPIFKKDGGEDDPNGTDALRGNWWQGSLYY